MKRIIFATAFALLAQSHNALPATAMALGKVYASQNSAELKDIITNTPNVVIDFSASWCGPCQRMEPIIHALAKEFTDITFITVDVDTFDDIYSIHPVKSMPTFVFFKNGKKMGFISKAQTPKEFKALLAKYF